ncbi:MAG TPA: hypothetical protein VGM50_16990, partial [Gemmatimonadaceae bacterium]
GLIAQNRDAQRRPRTIVTASLKQVDHWLDAYRKLWEDRFASLDDYLTHIEPTTPKLNAKAKASRRSQRGRTK